MSDAWLTLTDEQLRDEVIATGQEATGLPVGPSYGATQGEWETLAMTVQRLFVVAVRPIAESADPRRAHRPVPAATRAERCRAVPRHCRRHRGLHARHV